MASKELRAAWREVYAGKTKGHPVSKEALRIISEYRLPDTRELQRKKRAALRHVPAHLFDALRDRGLSAHLINRNSSKLDIRSRYLVVGIADKNGCKTVCIMHLNRETAVIKALSEAPFGAILIDTKEIH